MDTAGTPTHEPVLVREVLDLLAPALQGGGWCVDATLGLGGHAVAVLERFPYVRLFGLDRDPRALALAAERLAPFAERVRLERGCFSDLSHRLGLHDIGCIQGLLADLGVSSMQLDLGERGFSFQVDAPLDMRMGAPATQSLPSKSHPQESQSPESSTRDLLARAKTLDIEPDEPSAYDVINRYSEEKLANIFKQYGEERHAWRIARGVAEARRERPVETTGELVRLVAELKPTAARHPRSGRHPLRRPLHPATQVFQALRMEVNREMDELESLLDQSVALLEKEGRLVIISYHSGEDRRVKHTLRDLATGQIDRVTGRPRAETQVIEVLTKKPVRPSAGEVSQNPRSRSARLRAARRI